jgi:hypothetical protein
MIRRVGNGRVTLGNGAPPETTPLGYGGPVRLAADRPTHGRLQVNRGFAAHDPDVTGCDRGVTGLADCPLHIPPVTQEVVVQPLLNPEFHQVLATSAARRRRTRVADGLYSVARHAAPRARRRRHELLLISRAAAARTALLEVAALVRCSTDPSPECMAELHTLLTSGCDSPLYNPDVPAQQLVAILDRARATLATANTFAGASRTS